MKRYTGRTVTAIIETQPQKILLIKRDTVPFRNYWALPGGRVEPNENPEQAIVREVKEETGLDVEIDRKIGEYHEKGVQEGVEYDYYPACFLVKVVGGETKPQQGEIREIKLFELKDIPENLAFVHNDMIKDFLASRKAQPEI